MSSQDVADLLSIAVASIGGSGGGGGSGSTSSSPAMEPPPTFTIPSVFDPVFYNRPDAQSFLVHACPSSISDAGLQVILCMHPRPVSLPPNLGLPSSSSYEEKAFLQVAWETQPFVLQSQAPRSQSMQITVTEYLILLQFAANEWSRLKSKMRSQRTAMREGTDPIHITNYLMFYQHGSSHYQVSLSSRLIFKARMDSRDEKETVRTWLERHGDGGGRGSSSQQHQDMTLPMDAVVQLAKDVAGVKTLVDSLAEYKSKSRKRNRTVV